MNRRQFLALSSLWMLSHRTLASVPLPPEGRNPRGERAVDFSVIVPDFMGAYITDDDVTYLNETLQQLFEDYRGVLPNLTRLPEVVVINTVNEVLVQYGSDMIVPEITGDEALSLFDVQYLLTTTRFGSVATPHRGADIAHFGQLIYLKQHPQTGYRTPSHLLLEELIHVQQDITVMRGIIEREELDPVSCLHGQLKGISELGAHYYTDQLAGEPDYLFLFDDQTMLDDAVEAVRQLASRLGITESEMVDAIIFDSDVYAQIDADAFEREDKHIWEMVTTWRHVRDAEGKATDIAPAFVAF